MHSVQCAGSGCCMLLAMQRRAGRLSRMVLTCCIRRKLSMLWCAVPVLTARLRRAGNINHDVLSGSSEADSINRSLGLGGTYGFPPAPANLSPSPPSPHGPPGPSGPSRGDPKGSKRDPPKKKKKKKKNVTGRWLWM